AVPGRALRRRLHRPGHARALGLAGRALGQGHRPRGARVPGHGIRGGAERGRAAQPGRGSDPGQAGEDRGSPERGGPGHGHGLSRRATEERMGYEAINVERANGVTTITLNRPDAFNALSLTLGRELFQAALEADEDPGARCVVITGTGKAFCAGGDVKDFVDNLPRIGVHIKELTTYLHGAISRLARSDKPVIMAVNGVAASRRPSPRLR